jgi:hypothetical protein
MKKFRVGDEKPAQPPAEWNMSAAQKVPASTQKPKPTARERFDRQEPRTHWEWGPLSETIRDFRKFSRVPSRRRPTIGIVLTVIAFWRLNRNLED